MQCYVCLHVCVCNVMPCYVCVCNAVLIVMSACMYVCVMHPHPVSWRLCTVQPPYMSVCLSEGGEEEWALSGTMLPSSICSYHPKNQTKLQLEPPFCITTSAFGVSAKEVFILSLILLLLVYSVVAFLKHWNKNYRNINYSPHFSEAEAHLENGISIVKLGL